MNGGMPLILSRPTNAARMSYLRSLVSEVYLKDIVERKNIKREDVLSAILDLLCSSIRSLTNPTRVADTINTKQKRSRENLVALNTVKAYMDHLPDFFLFTECRRWDIKGKSYFDYPNKYYCEDIGLRNAQIGFRQQEMTHICSSGIPLSGGALCLLQIRQLLGNTGVDHLLQILSVDRHIRSRADLFVGFTCADRIYNRNGV